MQHDGLWNRSRESHAAWPADMGRASPEPSLGWTERVCQGDFAGTWQPIWRSMPKTVLGGGIADSGGPETIYE